MQMEKPGWLTRLLQSMLLEPSLHHQCKGFQLVLKNWQSTARHFDTAGCIHGCLRRNSVAAAHQENLQQLSSLTRIDHSTLEQIVSQS